MYTMISAPLVRPPELLLRMFVLAQADMCKLENNNVLLHLKWARSTVYLSIYQRLSSL